jgi:Mg2+-importing ATPase
MAIMVPVVFFVNGFRRGDWMEAFLFALSVAVGLTPEMLPMIVSTNLAKGAVNMSKEKVITKRLNSIQSFGAMDVLCTDKTGTITQDKIILEYYLDTEGKEDDRVLRHAFLNSYHQTGLRNLMDVAIIAHANDEGMSHLWENYVKVDEIPFDFNRRRMSVVVEDNNGKTQLITKGAIEEMLSVCAFVEDEGVVVPITDKLKQRVMKRVYEYNEDGLRVLGIAQKTNPAPAGAFSIQDESDMVLIGYLAFLDPPKESTSEAIAALSEYGVSVKILTGDNDAVTRSVCRQVGLDISDLMMGSEVEELTDEELELVANEVDVFAKLSPAQKVRIVAALRRSGHTVGFMGDGINDAAAMKEADVGISVDTAVDISKESADIILLEKDLMVLERGVIEGRRTYGNIIKYIKMTASSNFGNMFSVLAASWFLPFLPMLPLQILVLNLIYDISCITMPWDNVDDEFLRVPRNWDASSIGKFMIWLGPTSSVFDIVTYLLLFFFIAPAIAGGAWHTLGAGAAAVFIAVFHAGWFVESLWTQTLVIHMLRSPKVPILQTRASWQVTILTSAGILVGTILPFTPLGRAIGLAALPWYFFPILLAIIIGYIALVSVTKWAFIKRYGELL